MLVVAGATHGGIAGLQYTGVFIVTLGCYPYYIMQLASQPSLRKISLLTSMIGLDLWKRCSNIQAWRRSGITDWVCYSSFK
jgi:hypothetical protein